MRRSLLLAIVVFALGAAGFAAEAQPPPAELQLSLSKVNGFNLGGRIQGRFRLTASGPADVQRVTFLIDGAPIEDVAASPFKITFDTGSYALGRHSLSAIAVSASGGRLQSNTLTVEFVSPEAALNSTLQIFVPILAVVLVISVLAILGPLFGSGRRRQSRFGEYGLAGGAVCPRCGLSFSRHILTPRLFGQRLERCPHCGRWSLVGRATVEQLTEAEARQRGEQAHTPVASDDQDSFRRMIDDSRFDS